MTASERPPPKPRQHSRESDSNLFGPPPSVEERQAAGRALRLLRPREDHRGWVPPPKRPDPVDVIIKSNEGREPALVPIRHARMLTSPFAFLRGSAAVMAWDLAHTPVSGPRVQACGDCHLMNFGAFATPERNLIFDINDFDETLPAPFEWDVKRLAASGAVAGRHIGLSDTKCRAVARAAAQAYCVHMRRYSAMTVLDSWYDKITIEEVLQGLSQEGVKSTLPAQLRKLSQKTIAEHYYPKLVDTTTDTPKIKDTPPLIYHHPNQSSSDFLDVAMDGLRRYRLSLADHYKVLLDRFKIRDLAMKVVGVGSVGTFCWISLHTASSGDPLFLQIKEAKASVLEPYAGKSEYTNHGERVVAGQRLMQAASDIFLGWTIGRAQERHFYVRQLRDMKMSVVIESMNLERLLFYVRLCGWALARAHANSGDAVTISGYLGSGKTFSTAVAAFAMDYADQTNRDHRKLAEAVRDGRIAAVQ
jgi:uncharacterized protein (DUF2252 family)